MVIRAELEAHYTWANWNHRLRHSLQAADDVRISTAILIAETAVSGKLPTFKQIFDYHLAKRIHEYRRIALENHTKAWMQWRCDL